MKGTGTIRSRLVLKLFLSHLIIAGVGFLVLYVTARIQAPSSLDQHIRRMEEVIGENEFLRQNLMHSFQSALNETVLISTVGAVIVAAAVSSFLAWRIVAPVRSMMETVRRVAEGDYSRRANSVWNDELGELACAFNRMAERLESTEKRRVELIGNVAHELRTPLSSIRSLMEGVIDGVLPADYHSFSDVQSEISRLQRLVNDLEELSRAEAGKISLHFETLDFCALVHDVAERLGPQYLERRVSLRVECGKDIPEVSLDRHRIRQVLINLLGNALQYTQEGGTVKAVLTGEGARVRCTIEDTGIGLTSEDLNRIFERFYRVDKSRSRAGGGSGIGLTISKHIVEAHGGELTAESRGSGLGSRFSFTLPGRPE